MASCISVSRGALVASALALALPVALGAATLPTGFTETLVASGLSSPTAMAVRARRPARSSAEQGGQLARHQERRAAARRRS